MIFTGSGVAIITPMNNDFTINYNLFEQLIEWHIQQGTQAIIVSGTTGESATLSLEEKEELYRRAVAIAKRRVLIIANTGDNSTQRSVEASVNAQKIGVDGLLCVTPYYNKPTQAGLIAHFSAIASAVDLPIILYNVPSRTAISLSLESIVSLSHIDNVVGIKEASGDLSFVKSILTSTNQFAVYSGNDDQIVDVIELGGHGVISVSANLFPATIQSLCQLALQHSTQLAYTLKVQLADLHRDLFIESNPVPIKTAMEWLGFSVGPTRLPLVSLLPSSLTQLQKTFKQGFWHEDKS